MRWLFLLFFVSACTHSPQRREASLASDKLRANQPENPTGVELQVSVEQGPADLESTILVNPAILQCLRQGLDPKDRGFSVSLAGQLNAAGEVLSPLVVGPGPALRACLSAALKPLKFAGGEAGPFRLSLRRFVSGSKGKSFWLDLGHTKKFE
jgi:hypothetical protein